MLKKWEDFNESISILNSTRVSKENFLDKDKKFDKEDFTNYEINQIKKIADNLTIHFEYIEISTDSKKIVIKKLEDEWYLLEEIPNKLKGYESSPVSHRWGNGFHIADRFEELIDLLKFIMKTNEGYTTSNFSKKSRASFISSNMDDGPIVIKKFQTTGHTPYHTAKLSSGKVCCKYAIPTDLKNLSVISFSPTGTFYSFEDLKNKKIAYIFDIEIDDINLEDIFMKKILNYLKVSGIEIAVLDIMSDDPKMRLIKKFGFDYLYGEEDKDYPYESRMYLNLK